MSTEEATDGYWAEIKRAAYLKGADAGGAGGKAEHLAAGGEQVGDRSFP